MHVRKYHGVMPYDPNKSQPESGMDRLVVLWWKKTKDNPNPHATHCFSCPKWYPVLQGQDAIFADMLVEKVEELQNKTAHKFVTEALDSGMTCPQIPAELLDPQTILAAWREEQENSRGKSKLTTEEVTAWFTAELRELVMFALAEKKGWMQEGYQISQEQEKQLSQFAAGYGALYGKLTAPKPAVDKKYLEPLKNALELLPEDKKASDAVARKLAAKIDRMMTEGNEEITLEML